MRPYAGALRRAVAATLVLALAGCASVPGATREEQVRNADRLLEQALADVQRRHPASREELARAVGYVVMDNTVTKIPLVGGGQGYGVAVERATGRKTYLRMGRFDFGAGWGVRKVRPVLIFFDPDKFRRFIDGRFEVRLVAEAAAKVGGTGAAGATTGRQGDGTGYAGYLLTDAGMSASWVLGFIRVTPVRLRDAD